MGGRIIKSRNINQVTDRFTHAGDKERFLSPQIVQPTKSGRHNAVTGVRIAYCKDNASTGLTINCFLGVDETGPEITVTCAITGGGTDLNKALPQLSDGLPMLVYNDQGTWRSVFPFQRIDITHHDIVSGKFSSLIYECPP